MSLISIFQSVHLSRSTQIRMYPYGNSTYGSHSPFGSSDSPFGDFPFDGDTHFSPFGDHSLIGARLSQLRIEHIALGDNINFDQAVINQQRSNFARGFSTSTSIRSTHRRSLTSTARSATTTATGSSCPSSRRTRRTSALTMSSRRQRASSTSRSTSNSTHS